MNALALPSLLVTERLGRASSWPRYAVNRGTGYPAARAGEHGLERTVKITRLKSTSDTRREYESTILPV
jgi:hypothetical protein